MKIAFFCDEYPPKPHGGIGTFVKTIAETLAKRGHQISVVEFAAVPGVRVNNDVRIVSLLRSSMPKMAWLINRYRLWRWIVRAGTVKMIDIFELPEYQGWLPFPATAKHVRTVVRLHQSATAIRQFSGETINIRDAGCEFLTLFFHRRWIGVSKFILDLTSEVFHLTPSPGMVVYNPITIEDSMVASLPTIRPLNSPYVLFVGSMTERKGVLTLARAAKILFDRCVPIHFVFVGPDSPYKGRAITREILDIVGDGNDSRVIFAGRLAHEQVLYWMRHAVTTALPSRLEAFSLVPMESMALGVPAIFSTTCSGPELIENGVDGILIDPDDAESLAAHIYELLTNKKYAADIAATGNQTVRSRFGLDVCIKKTIEFYDAISPYHGDD